MQKSIDKLTVLQRLDELRRRDPERNLFGANGHGYKLRPPLPVSEIESVEKRYSVSLPDDYKNFITQIGNGGAGPYYGLFPFGQHDNSDHFCKWEDGGMVGDLSRPFPHATEWNLPDSFWQKLPNPPPDISLQEEDKLMEAWDRELEHHYWKPAIMNGAIPICHLGCALRQWLVVNGDQRGFVWNDFRADYRGLSPVRDKGGKDMTFTDWYMAWLEKPGVFMDC
jgi:hypothetical protein